MASTIADLEEQIARYSALLRSITDAPLRAELTRLLTEARSARAALRAQDERLDDTR